MTTKEFILRAIAAVEKMFNQPYTVQIKKNYYERFYDPNQEEWVDGYCWLGAASYGMGMSFSTVQHIMVLNGFHIADWNDTKGLSWQEINQKLLEYVENG